MSSNGKSNSNFIRQVLVAISRAWGNNLYMPFPYCSSTIKDTVLIPTTLLLRASLDQPERLLFQQHNVLAHRLLETGEIFLELINKRLSQGFPTPISFEQWMIIYLESRTTTTNTFSFFQLKSVYYSFPLYFFPASFLVRADFIESSKRIERRYYHNIQQSEV